LLLAVLLLHANQPVGRDRLVDLLWGEAPPRSAVANLHTYAAQLRMLIASGAALEGPPRLRATGGGYTLAVAAGDLDLLRFQSLLGKGRQALADGHPAVAAERLTRALALWRGRPLEDLPVPDGLAPKLAQLEEQHLTAAEDCFDARLALGQHAAVAADIAALTEAHPLRERLWIQRMLAEYRAGRRADALAGYRQLYRILADQLGICPGEPVQRLHQQMLAGDPALNLRRSTVALGRHPAPHGPPSTQPPPNAVEQPPGPATSANPGVPHQLPIGVRGFAGRECELARLEAMLATVITQPTAAAVAVLSGTAGVGKTALAVHWAHRVADRFPDGQLYVNLGGFDPSASAVRPAQVVRDFLDAFEVPSERVPASVEAQVGFYRSLLATRRVLLVLDNARDAEQVRPLLPGAPGSLVVVTSRNHMTGLVAAEGAHSVTVDLLTAADAREMLARRLGTARVNGDPQAADDIIALCARLPLALAVAGARADSRPAFPLGTLARELWDVRAGLDAFVSGDAATDVRAVFSWSYRTLTPAAARLFRLLGLHTGPDTAVPAAASLAGMPPHGMRPLLAELARAHLVVEHVPGRYGCHDLLRAYAAELVAEMDTEPDRRGAVRRMLDHYLHTAREACRLLDPHRMCSRSSRQCPGWTFIRSPIAPRLCTGSLPSTPY
jgi:DNA-binding SARP family transcriptional activator